MQALLALVPVPVQGDPVVRPWVLPEWPQLQVQVALETVPSAAQQVQEPQQAQVLSAQAQ